VRELAGICGGNVCLLVKSESFDTFGPHTCLSSEGGQSIVFGRKKEQKHFPTFSLLSPFDLPADTGEVKNSAGAFWVSAPWLINLPT